MASILIKDTTREERIRIVHQALWGACGIDCEFCSVYRRHKRDPGDQRGVSRPVCPRISKEK